MYQKKKKSIQLLLLIWTSLLLIMVGCAKKNPPLTQVVISSDSKNPTTAGPSPFDFGQAGSNVNHIFSITNTGSTAIVIPQVSAEAFKLTSPFSLTPATGTDCVSGVTLAPNATCTIKIEFTPVISGVATSSINVSYSSGDKNGTAIQNLTGTGVLNSPVLLISSDPANPTTVGLPPFDFGTIKVAENTTHNFIIINNGSVAAVLGDVTSAGFQLASPFSIVAATAGGTNCSSGMTLAANATCTFTVKYSPEDATLSTGKIVVSYTASGSTDPGMSASSAVIGKAILDCSVAALAPSFQKGIDAANSQMAIDAAKGAIDGAALTYNDGVRDGYNSSYQNAYNNGYNGPNGYPAGYNAGYIASSTGHQYQVNCQSGSTAGFNDGLRVGNIDGQKDGYDDGYSDGYAIGNNNGLNDGYNDGYPDGYDRGSSGGSSSGYSDGYNACYDSAYDSSYDIGYDDGYNSYVCYSDSSASVVVKKTAKAKSIVDSENACYNQGYNATYSSSAYWNAYNQAKANNTRYQSGVTDGRAQGIVDGTANGISDGYNAGYAVGLVDGANATYSACYNQSYPVGYRDGYNGGYNVGYASGVNHGNVDGYNSGYDSGYYSGESDGYSDGFNSNYQGAYDSGCNAGYSEGDYEGYYAGYDVGYSDADSWCFDTYGAEAAAASKTKAISIKDANAPILKILYPKPIVRSNNTENLLKLAKGEIKITQGKRYKTHASVAKKTFGTDQTWWNVNATSGFGAERFAGSRLPKILNSIIGNSNNNEARSLLSGWRKSLRSANMEKRTKALKSK
ncbi:MAG: choice-of-anchor D domain-containing protein [Oligoflexia bacterium]|nr:choice-of-anchor D domain-containing protein [Oligoflexia bacterium]